MLHAFKKLRRTSVNADIGKRLQILSKVVSVPSFGTDFGKIINDHDDDRLNKLQKEISDPQTVLKIREKFETLNNRRNFDE